MRGASVPTLNIFPQQRSHLHIVRYEDDGRSLMFIILHLSSSLSCDFRNKTSGKKTTVKLVLVVLEIRQKLVKVDGAAQCPCVTISSVLSPILATSGPDCMTLRNMFRDIELLHGILDGATDHLCNNSLVGVIQSANEWVVVQNCLCPAQRLNSLWVSQDRSRSRKV